jgi:type VI secretion system protein ImpH
VATESRKPDAAVAQPLVRGALEKEPTSFEFFQAVRVLERLLPQRVPVGRYGDPGDEVVHFGVPPVIGFPPSEIRSLTVREDAPSDMQINFMGVTGPLGVLPLYYTLFVADRARQKDTALRDFLDIFHHRMISLFYLAWEKHRFAVAYERDRRDRMTEHLMDLVGLGFESHRDHFMIRDESLLFYTGLLAPQPRSSAGLARLLEDYFGVKAEVIEFVGAWYRLSQSDQCRIDDAEGLGGRLGFGAVAGDEIWDQQARVRLRLGPLSRKQYDQFLPGRSGHEALRTLTRFYSNDQFGFEVQLVLERDDVPPCVLGADEVSVPLGLCTWIRTEPFHRDADETILSLSE